MPITERQAEILDKIVEEYINSAQPISSRLIEKKYDFEICPATIRIEMQKLTDTGYLYQPHTSAGRIPTDKGYRFFVDDLLEKEISNFKNIFEIEEIIKKEKEDILKFVSHISKFLSTYSSSLAAVHLLERDLFWKEGWEDILKEPEFKENGFISDFAEFLEEFEEKPKRLKINSGIKIYIGKENPLPRGKNFSIISSKCCLPDEEEVILALLGPKRMDYDRNISLINSLIKSLEKI